MKTMKSILKLSCLGLGVAIAGASVSAMAQGTVFFDSKQSGARAFMPDGVTPLTGQAFAAQLYSAAGMNAPESALARSGNPTYFRSGINAGYTATSGNFRGVDVDPVVTVNTSTPGGASTIQFRAWDAKFDTYENAADKGITGKSPLLSISVTGNPAGEPPTTPVDITGLQGFTTTDAVPEPSTFALIGLGLAGAVAFRKRTASKHS